MSRTFETHEITKLLDVLIGKVEADRIRRAQTRQPQEAD